MLTPRIPWTKQIETWNSNQWQDQLQIIPFLLSQRVIHCVICLIMFHIWSVTHEISFLKTWFVCQIQDIRFNKRLFFFLHFISYSSCILFGRSALAFFFLYNFCWKLISSAHIDSFGTQSSRSTMFTWKYETAFTTTHKMNMLPMK